MAMIVRLFSVALLAYIASAGDQWYLGACPDFRKSAAANIPYNSTTGFTAYIGNLAMRGPFKVIAAAESQQASQYSCVTMSYSGGGYEISYYINGTMASPVPFGFNVEKQSFAAKLPAGLMGVPDADKERTWTIVSDENGVIAMKTCKGAFVSHFTSTYFLVDKTIDTGALNMTCLIPAIDKTFKLQSAQKGVC